MCAYDGNGAAHVRHGWLPCVGTCPKPAGLQMTDRLMMIDRLTLPAFHRRPRARGCSDWPALTSQVWGRWRGLPAAIQSLHRWGVCRAGKLNWLLVSCLLPLASFSREEIEGRGTHNQA
jgi:hypothetical protein